MSLVLRMSCTVLAAAFLAAGLAHAQPDRTERVVTQIGPGEYPQLAENGEYVCRIANAESSLASFIVQPSPCSQIEHRPYVVTAKSDEDLMVVYMTLRYFTQYLEDNQEAVTQFTNANCPGAIERHADGPPVTSSPFEHLEFPHWSDQPLTIRADLHRHVCGGTGDRWVALQADWLADTGAFSDVRLTLYVID